MTMIKKNNSKLGR